MKYSRRDLDLDSEIFGIKFSKLEFKDSEEYEQVDFELLIKELYEANISYASTRIPSKRIDLAHLLEKNSFVIVDSLVCLDLALTNSATTELSSNIRDAEKKDLATLKKIAEESFTENRFYLDPFFYNLKDKVKIIYSTWIENSFRKVAADNVYVYLDNGRVAGFITTEKDGHIKLLAVDEASRGKGIAGELIRYSINKFLTDRIKKVQIEAVLSNIAAIRLYESLGFKISNSYYTLAWHNDSITSNN